MGSLPYLEERPLSSNRFLLLSVLNVRLEQLLHARPKAVGQGAAIRPPVGELVLDAILRDTQPQDGLYELMRLMQRLWAGHMCQQVCFLQCYRTYMNDLKCR